MKNAWRIAGSLAGFAMVLAGCRQAAEMRAPEYCRYTEIGPLCDGFDPGAVPYTVALGLRPLETIAAADRGIVRGFVATLPAAPGSIRVLAPVGSAPAGRAGFDPSMPQRFPRTGNPRLLILALGRDAGRVDLHSLILVEDRVATSQALATGLRAGTLRGLAANGRFDLGFSLADQPGSLGDVYRLRARGPQPTGMPVHEWVASLGWTRIRAETPERKLDYFRSIVNSGSCSDMAGPRPLLLAPVPLAWIDEYERDCPFHPDRAWYGSDRNGEMLGNSA
jgi:hypothetical protein